jgi:mRNA-degrading endonuclease RelE of RelBE toxin-antitoxin system
MYRVLLERAAEKELSRLSPEIHDRIVTAIAARFFHLASTCFQNQGDIVLAGVPDDVKIVATRVNSVVLLL